MLFKIFCLLLFFSSSLLASSYLDEKLNQAKDLKLFNDSYWHKLLHYENNISSIEDKNFFLSSNGSTHPKDELLATIKKFILNPSTICKFPARYKWLQNRIDLEVSHHKCKMLEEFLQPDFRSIDLIFTSEKFNTAGSMFGHTFLKINSNTIPYAVNYSAKIPNNINPFTYAYRGIFGQFDSSYKFLSFSKKHYEYLNEDFRDLLQVKLLLNHDEIENIMLHLYELKDKKQRYYFLSRNCSSEIIKLLDIGMYNSSLDNDLHGLAIPIDSLYIIKKHHLIKSITQKLSKLKLFYNTVQTLTYDEKKILFLLVHHKISSTSIYSNPEISSKSKEIINYCAIKYIEITSIKRELTSKDVSLLVHLISLSNNSELSRKDIQLSKIPLSNRLNKLSLGSNYINELGPQYTISYRYLFRNRLDLMDDIVKYGTIDLLDISLRYSNNQLSLNYLTIIDLETVPDSNIFFQETTNRVKLGAERIFFDKKLYGYFHYAKGYRYKLAQNFRFSASLDFGLFLREDLMLSLSPDLSIEYKYNNKLVSQLNYSYQPYTNNIRVQKFSLQTYIKIADYTRVNLNLQRNKEDSKIYNSFTVNYSFFF